MIEMGVPSAKKKEVKGIIEQILDFRNVLTENVGVRAKKMIKYENPEKYEGGGIKVQKKGTTIQKAGKSIY